MFDLVPTRTSKRIGSHLDHESAARFVHPVVRHVSGEPPEQTFRLSDEPDEVKHLPHSGHAVDSRGVNRSPSGHARELGTHLDPHRRVPRCCPRAL